MVLLARTTPLEEVQKPSEGLSLFFIDNYRIPADTLIGEEGQGFKMILHGMNAERCLLAGEALGLGYAALKKYRGAMRDRSYTNAVSGQRNMPKSVLYLVALSARTKAFSTLLHRR